ncbi:uncharacterized protein VP01_323g8 [Puccinia sorghi]|uniref:Histone H1 n=1 Tax=Puccinia sorghi TaxID=27349 RepID=A0A0L6UY13_9BASI|nr:uncharacterized protein VP01_323g8 [Puccinia sorghi]
MVKQICPKMGRINMVNKLKCDLLLGKNSQNEVVEPSQISMGSELPCPGAVRWGLNQLWLAINYVVRISSELTTLDSRRVRGRFCQCAKRRLMLGLGPDCMRTARQRVRNLTNGSTPLGLIGRASSLTTRGLLVPPVGRPRAAVIADVGSPAQAASKPSSKAKPASKSKAPSSKTKPVSASAKKPVSAAKKPVSSATKKPISSATKKATAPKKTSVSAPKASSADLKLTMEDMIKDAIQNDKENVRGGVSRPAIKKYLAFRFKVLDTPANITRLNKAIQRGAEKGIFALPKGASGKVKLAKVVSEPKVSKPASKVAKPVSKSAAVRKPTKPKVAAKKAGAETLAAKKVTKKVPTASLKKIATAKEAILLIVHRQKDKLNDKKG